MAAEINILEYIPFCTCAGIFKIVPGGVTVVESESMGICNFSSIPAVPNLFGTGDRFCGRQFFHGLGRGG